MSSAQENGPRIDIARAADGHWTAMVRGFSIGMQRARGGIGGDDWSLLQRRLRALEAQLEECYPGQKEGAVSP